MSQPLPTPFRRLPMPLQRAVEQFAGLARRHCTAERLASLVDGHLEAYGLADASRRSAHLASAFTMARLRFGIHVDRRHEARPAPLPGRDTL